MNFSDPNVKMRVIEHILFATEAASAALPDTGDDSMPEEVKALRAQLKIPVILQLLSFTLGLDYRLRNTIQPTEDLLTKDGLKRVTDR